MTVTPAGVGRLGVDTAPGGVCSSINVRGEIRLVMGSSSESFSLKGIANRRFEPSIRTHTTPGSFVRRERHGDQRCGEALHAARGFGTTEPAVRTLVLR